MYVVRRFYILSENAPVNIVHEPLDIGMEILKRAKQAHEAIKCDCMGSFKEALVKCSSDKIRSMATRILPRNDLDKGEWTLLHAAAHWGRLEMLVLLLRAGLRANIVTPDASQWSVLGCACSAGQMHVVQYLVEEHHLPPGGVVNAEGETALSLASRTGNKTLVKYLLGNKDARDEINSVTFSGETALSLANAENYRLCVEMLVAAGADIHHRDNKQRNLLHSALLKGYADLAKLWLENRIDFTAVDFESNTCLHLAVLSCNPEVVALTLTLDIELNQKNNKGATAKDMAYKIRNTDIILLLTSSDLPQQCGGESNSDSGQRSVEP